MSLRLCPGGESALNSGRPRIEFLIEHSDLHNPASRWDHITADANDHHHCTGLDNDHQSSDYHCHLHDRGTNTHNAMFLGTRHAARGLLLLGFIKSIDTDAKTLVFDLARFVRTGEEDYEFELINNNPLLRTLDVGEDVVVNSCPPAESEPVPDECESLGSPADWEHFTLDELAGWVANGYEFWGLFLVDDKITLVEHWWHP